MQINKLGLVFFACMFGLSVVLYLAWAKSWDCGYKLTIGSIVRTDNGLSISNTQIETPGVIMPDEIFSLGGPAFQTNVRGDGNYRFRYSANVSKISLWSGQTKVYEGLPIASFKLKRGTLGIEPVAAGPAMVEAQCRCSVGLFIENL
ncbi:MAG: hypothetical protein V4805_03630 [Pseudomonadota bacterium]